LKICLVKNESASPNVFTCNFDETSDEMVQLLDFSRQKSELIKLKDDQDQSLQLLDESYKLQIDKLKRRHQLEQKILEREFQEKKKLLTNQKTQSLDRKSLRQLEKNEFIDRNKSDIEKKDGLNEIKILTVEKQDFEVSQSEEIQVLDKSGHNNPKHQSKMHYRKSFRKPLIEQVEHLQSEDQSHDEDQSRKVKRKPNWKSNSLKTLQFQGSTSPDSKHKESENNAGKKSFNDEEEQEEEEKSLEEEVVNEKDEEIDFEEVTELTRPSSLMFKQRLSYKVNKSGNKSDENPPAAETTMWDSVAKKALNKLKKINLREEQIKSIFNLSSKSKSKADMDDLMIEESENKQAKSSPERDSFLVVKKDLANGEELKNLKGDFFEIPLGRNTESLNFQLKVVKNPLTNPVHIPTFDSKIVERGRARLPGRKDSLLNTAKEQILKRFQPIDDEDGANYHFKDLCKEKLRDLLSRSKSLPPKAFLKLQSRQNFNKSEHNLEKASPQPEPTNFGSLVVNVRGNWNNPESSRANMEPGYLDDSQRLVRDDTNLIKVIIDVRMNLCENSLDDAGQRRKEESL